MRLVFQPIISWYILLLVGILLLAEVVFVIIRVKKTNSSRV